MSTHCYRTRQGMTAEENLKTPLNQKDAEILETRYQLSFGVLQQMKDTSIFEEWTTLKKEKYTAPWLLERAVRGYYPELQAALFYNQTLQSQFVAETDKEGNFIKGTFAQPGMWLEALENACEYVLTTCTDWKEVFTWTRTNQEGKAVSSASRLFCECLKNYLPVQTAPDVGHINVREPVALLEPRSAEARALMDATKIKRENGREILEATLAAAKNNPEKNEILARWERLESDLKDYVRNDLETPEPFLTEFDYRLIVGITKILAPEKFKGLEHPPWLPIPYGVLAKVMGESRRSDAYFRKKVDEALRKMKNTPFKRAVLVRPKGEETYRPFKRTDLSHYRMESQELEESLRGTELYMVAVEGLEVPCRHRGRITSGILIPTIPYVMRLAIEHKQLQSSTTQRLKAGGVRSDAQGASQAVRLLKTRLDNRNNTKPQKIYLEDLFKPAGVRKNKDRVLKAFENTLQDLKNTNKIKSFSFVWKKASNGRKDYNASYIYVVK